MLAARSHSGQVDKGGKPYVLHPLRLMMQFEREEEMIVAVLHDVMEDSDVSYSDLLRAGFSVDVAEAVRCLTRGDSESYQDYVRRVAQNEIAARVKIADLRDNLNLSRIDEVDESDLARIKKYQLALKHL
ncbi:MAG: GTP pyrophosphokinase, partial [Hyphomicrobiaceae bacterium]|nr:GTP pyrophosphokinase [Hyphomicrobiaceae bacterium]